MPRTRARRAVSEAAEVGVRLAGELRRILIAQIEVGHGRVRRDLGPIGDLAASLNETGLLNPITVYERDGRYHLIAGERRLEASKRLGSTHIDALVRPLGPKEDPLVLELVENLQRRELSDEEEADAFITLVRDKRHAMLAVAESVGRSVAYISKRIRVFEDDALRQSIARGHVSVSMAEELLTVPAAQRAALLARATEEDWSAHGGRAAVRALQQALAAEAESAAATAANQDVAADSTDVEDQDLEEPSPAHTGTPTRTQRVSMDRPDDLHVRVRELNHILSSLRPFQFTRRDDREMAALFRTLRLIAQATREKRTVFPSLDEAAALSRQRRARSP